MSAPEKLRGGSSAELTKLKTLWRDSLSESARDFWRALFVSDTKQADIRQQIAARLKVKLSYDPQLNQFRRWLKEQDLRDLEAERMTQDETDLKARFGEKI